MIDIERTGRFVPEEEPTTTGSPSQALAMPSPQVWTAHRLLAAAEDIACMSPDEATRLTLRALAILVQWEADHEDAIAAILDTKDGQ